MLSTRKLEWLTFTLVSLYGPADLVTRASGGQIPAGLVVFSLAYITWAIKLGYPNEE